MLDKIPFLLKLEWMKLKPLASFKVSVIFYLILLPATFLFFKTLSNPLSGLIDNYYVLPKSWHTMAYIASWMTFFFLPFLAIDSVTTEFTNKTLRQNIINGMNRNEYLFGKVLMMIALSFGATLYAIICALVFGLTSGKSMDGNSFSTFHYMGLFFIQNIGFMSLGLMLAVLLRRSGFALFIFFPYTLLIELILGGLLLYMIQTNTLYQITCLLPAFDISSLIPFPFKQTVTDLAGELNPYSYPPFWLTISFALFYIFVFNVISFMNFNRRDL
jgi:ABC-2 type transport system permease protein